MNVGDNDAKKIHTESKNMCDITSVCSDSVEDTFAAVGTLIAYKIADRVDKLSNWQPNYVNQLFGTKTVECKYRDRQHKTTVIRI